MAANWSLPKRIKIIFWHPDIIYWIYFAPAGYIQGVAKYVVHLRLNISHVFHYGDNGNIQ